MKKFFLCIFLNIIVGTQVVQASQEHDNVQQDSTNFLLTIKCPESIVDDISKPNKPAALVSKSVMARIANEKSATETVSVFPVKSSSSAWVSKSAMARRANEKLLYDKTSISPVGGYPLESPVALPKLHVKPKAQVEFSSDEQACEKVFTIIQNEKMYDYNNAILELLDSGNLTFDRAKKINKKIKAHIAFFPLENKKYFFSIAGAVNKIEGSPYPRVSFEAVYKKQLELEELQINEQATAEQKTFENLSVQGLQDQYSKVFRADGNWSELTKIKKQIEKIKKSQK